jgi:hypothetical protein
MKPGAPWTDSGLRKENQSETNRRILGCLVGRVKLEGVENV